MKIVFTSFRINSKILLKELFIEKNKDVRRNRKFLLFLCVMKLKGEKEMADNKKRTTSSKKTKTSGSASSANSKTRKGAKSAKRQNADFGEFHEEIIIIVSTVLMIFFMLSNFSLCGKLGDTISGVFFGVFGGIQYVLPVLVFLAVALLVSNGFSSLAIKKVILGAVSILSISAFWQLVLGLNIDTAKNAYRYSSIRHIGGGYIGTAISNFLSKYLGTVGAYLIIIAILLISIVLITEHSFLSIVKKGSGTVARNVKVQSEVAKKNIAEIREQRRAQAEAKALLNEEERKNLIKDPDLYKKTMVLPEDAVFSQKTPLLNKKENQKKKSSVPEIRELRYDGSQINFELDKMAEENKEKKVEPKFHFMYDDKKVQEVTENKEEVSSTPIVEEVGVNHAPKMEHVTEPKSGWDLDLDSLPTEEELLLQGSKPAREVKLAPRDEIMVKKAEKVSFDEKQAVADKKELVSPQRQEEDGDGYSVKKAVSMSMGEKKDAGSMTKSMQVVKQMITPSSKGQGETPTVSMKEDIQKTELIQPKPYVFPPMDLLKRGERMQNADGEAELRATAQKLQQTLENFGVGVTITDVSQGPSVTRYELQPEQGVKVSKIVSLSDDIKLNLAAADIRIEAPIPGKAAVGIEVPNKTNATVMFRDLIENEEFRKYPSDIAFAVGKDIGGKTIVTDIAKMPHLLIAGATGSGKSVCINTLIMSILYKAKPTDVKLIMIDPKVVELSTYNGIPHLLIPVVTDPKKASSALNWAVMEMTDRYKKFAEVNVRNLKGYNAKVEEVLAKENSDLQKLPQIVIIVDELADLMMVAPGEVEDAIVRLSQLARAAGIHLVIATQRPSVNVITGLIKANVPSRIAFSVSSGVDSRTIIDMNGAEKLLGKGDMLFYPAGYQKPVRVQGAFISDDEVTNVVEFLKEQAKESGMVSNTSDIEEKINSAVSSGGIGSSERDEYFVDAGRFIIEKEKASIGMLQRMFKIGFNRAARIMDQLSEAGIVGPEEGTKPRKVIMSMEEFEQYIDEYL